MVIIDAMVALFEALVTNTKLTLVVLGMALFVGAVVLVVWKVVLPWLM